MTLVRDALASVITRWLPVLEEAELRAVEGFVLELVIAARERAIDLSARDAAANPPTVPHGVAAPRADAITEVSCGAQEGNRRSKPTASTLSPVERGLRELRAHDWPGVAELRVVEDPDATWPRNKFDTSDGEP